MIKFFVYLCFIAGLVSVISAPFRVFNKISHGGFNFGRNGKFGRSNDNFGTESNGVDGAGYCRGTDGREYGAGYYRGADGREYGADRNQYGFDDVYDSVGRNNNSNDYYQQT